MMLSLARNLLFSTILFLFFFSFFPLSQAVGTTARYSLVAPIYKDAKTSLHTVTLLMRSPLTPLNLTLDLGGRYVWVVCEQGYKSVFYHPVQCGTRKCKFAGYTSCGDCDEGPIRPGCNNNTCTLTTENPVPPVDTTGQVSEDMLAVASSNGSVPGFYPTSHASSLLVRRSFSYGTSPNNLEAWPLWAFTGYRFPTSSRDPSPSLASLPSASRHQPGRIR